MTDLFHVDLTTLIPMLLGVAGFLVYAGADLALCFGRLTSAGLGFYLLNACAAMLIGVSLLYSFNLGAFLTEAFCLVTSLTAIGLRLRTRMRRTQPESVTPRTPAGPRAPIGPRAMPSRQIGPGHGLRPDRMI